MQIQAEVLAEDIRNSNGVEYVTVTCRELSAKPLLQMIDYTLRKEEADLKGKLLNQRVDINVQTIRAIFSGRPQLSGSLTVLKK